MFSTDQILSMSLFMMRNGGFPYTMTGMWTENFYIHLCYLSSVKRKIELLEDIWSWPFYRRLFELLVLSCALAELTWPEILKRRQLFRYWFCNVEKKKSILLGFFHNIHAESSRDIFMDFDPAAVSKINEKKLVAPGSVAHSLLSEQKLRAVLENARQIIKVCSACLFTAQIWFLCWNV